MDITKDFVKTVENRAKKLGLSPESIVAEAGITTSLWNRWTSGDGDPSVLTMERIEKTLERMEANA